MLVTQVKPSTLCGPRIDSRVLVEAVTFDFFNTLVFHREGRGRGKILVEYLQDQGLQPGPWDHKALYGIFALHDRAYSPTGSAEEKRQYYVDLAARVLDYMGIQDSRAHAPEHADALWAMLGPTCFEVFPDVPATLRTLRARGLKLAVVSNWQSGLRHFCAELEIAHHFDHILSSADLGLEKPDHRIFLEASKHLGVPPASILHVGDTHLDDYVGGGSAGLRVALLDRAGSHESDSTRVVRSLSAILELVTSPAEGSGPHNTGLDLTLR